MKARIERRIERKLEFPLFCVTALGNGFVVAGGGGGTARSGVPNGITVLRWPSLTPACSALGIDDSVTNIAAAPRTLGFAFGHGCSCSLARLNETEGSGDVRIDVCATVATVTRRSAAERKAAGDDEDEDELQRAVAFGATLETLVTGASTGEIRLWRVTDQFAGLTPLFRLTGCKGPITGLAMNSKNVAATSAGDAKCRIWPIGVSALAEGAQTGALQPLRVLATNEFPLAKLRPAMSCTFRGCSFAGEELFLAASQTRGFTWVVDSRGPSAIVATSGRNSCFVVEPQSQTQSGASAGVVALFGNNEGDVLAVKSSRLPRTTTILHARARHSFVVTAVALSPGGTHALSVGLDSCVCATQMRSMSTPTSTSRVFRCTLLVAIIVALLAVVYSVLSAFNRNRSA